MVVVFGKNGQIAQAFGELAPQWTYLSSQDAPFTDEKKVLAHLHRLQPQIIINAAAYTAVDKAESERELAVQINATIPGVLAKWSAQNNAHLIHFSTDYVFNGTGETPWVETDKPDPVNWYGHSKWQGDQLILSSDCQHSLFRISWVYSHHGHNFRNTIRRLACEKKELRIVNDQWGAPTSARSVTQALTPLVQQSLNGTMALTKGLYHLQFEPYTTWYDFALRIIEEARNEGLPVMIENVIGIPTEAYPTPARRPKNSRLGTLHPQLFSENKHNA